MDISLKIFLYSLYGIVILLFAGMIWWLHRSPDTFDAKGMFADENGRASLSKIGQLVSLLTTTWVIFYLTVIDKLTEEFLGLYLLTWAASEALNGYFGTKQAK